MGDSLDRQRAANVALFDRYRARLVNHLARLCGRRDDAEDAAQALAVYLSRAPVVVPPEGAWCYLRAAGRYRLAALRRPAVVSLDTPARDDGDELVLVDTLADPAAGPEEVTLAGEGVRLVRAALDSADPRDRLVLTRLAAGESQARVAARLGVNRARVGQLAARARQRLAEALAVCTASPS